MKCRTLSCTNEAEQGRAFCAQCRDGRKKVKQVDLEMRPLPSGGIKAFSRLSRSISFVNDKFTLRMGEDRLREVQKASDALRVEVLKRLRVKPLKECGEETIELEPGEWDETVELFIGALKSADIDQIISEEE